LRHQSFCFAHCIFILQEKKLVKPDVDHAAQLILKKSKSKSINIKTNQAHTLAPSVQFLQISISDLPVSNDLLKLL
jgi:hypothetical protein